MSTVAIIIVNYNGWRDTIALLDSLERLSYRDFFVVVVDNASPDPENKTRLTRYTATRYPLKLIFNDHNIGFSGGNNRGMAYAHEKGASYFFLLNNDTLVEPECLTRLVAFLDQCQGKRWVSPSIFFADRPDTIWFGGGSFNWLAGGKHRYYGFAGSFLPPEARQCDFLTFAAVLMPRETIDDIGYMDERFFLYYEDVDYSLSARRAGYTLWMVPNTRIIHKASVTTKKLGTPSIMRYHHRNILLLAEKHLPRVMRPCMHIWVGWMLAKQYGKIFFFPSHRDIAVGIREGVFDYYRRNFGRIP
ncbi:MAG: glycosyltransferase family 2 protein [Parcubacteria group bacterium]|nr:glycosyltransferase family 2 protein [Parcubacteria group bacterium]